ncbi:MAG: MerR family transcriptional regulator [Myxococcales bacterium]|nr:MerR family transcriptional regulator [Myxococcales bacterium]
MYSTAAVAKITGIPAETLRTWERRHAIVQPGRTAGGQRRYSEQDVQRLKRIARLLERGERISSLASLDLAELDARLQAHAPAASEGRPTVARVAFVGPADRHLDGLSADGIRVTVTVRAEHDADLAPSEADLLVVDLGEAAVCGAEILELSTRLGDLPVVVVCSFLPRSDRGLLDRPHVRIVRSPATVSEVRQAVVDLWSAHPAASTATTPARHYTEAQLLRLMETRPELDCECPKHLARLVASLAAFEAYSERCVDLSPADARVHQTLHQGTADARAVMERMLAVVCEHEGIEP